MANWLLKTESSVYSYDNLVKDKKATWDGVTNPVALKNIRCMKKGDMAFIYHTGDEKQIIGIAEVVSEPYSDPKQKEPKLVVIDLKPKEKLKRPVTLAEIKADKRFSDFILVRMSRLSVVPVTEKQWDMLLEMSRN